jgi:hypothetical protein
MQVIVSFMSSPPHGKLVAENEDEPSMAFAPFEKP